jgi:hypothetical protein
VISEQPETTVNTEHTTENHGVPGSSPGPATSGLSGISLFKPQKRNYSDAEFGFCSSLFWSFPGDVAVRVTVNTFVTGQLLGCYGFRRLLGSLPTRVAIALTYSFTSLAV